jgi:hypothetical protein
VRDLGWVAVLGGGFEPGGAGGGVDGAGRGGRGFCFGGHGEMGI